MIISDTIYYRPDGTISSVVRRETVTFTGPKGETFDKDTERQIELSAIAQHTGPGYEDLDLQNKYLEGQIEAERVAAETEKLAAVRAISEAKDAVIAEKEAAIAERDVAIAAKDAEIAEVAARAEVVKQ